MWIPGWKSDLNMAPQVMDGDSEILTVFQVNALLVWILGLYMRLQEMHHL